MLMQLLSIIGILLLVWVLYRGIKNNPESFSRENLSKSFRTVGLLALGLIALISLTVWFLK